MQTNKTIKIELKQMRLQTKSKLFFSLIIFVVLFSIGSPIYAAVDLEIGTVCTDNAECKTNSCEQSNLTGTATKYCTCSTDQHCIDKYGLSEVGEVWTCTAGSPQSNDLHFCSSDKRGIQMPISAAAATPPPATPSDVTPITLSPPTIKIPIPELQNFSQIEVSPGQIASIPYMAEYIIAIYKYSIVIGSILAVAILMIGGLMYTMGGMNATLINKSKTMIFGAISGIVILIFSHLTLSLINPTITNLTAIDIDIQPRAPLIDVIPNDASTAPVGATYTGPITQTPSNVPDYKQFSSPWGSTVFGYNSTKCDCDGIHSGECNRRSTVCCTTIHQGGCGPTSLAMVLASYGVPVTPDLTSAFAGIQGNGRVCNTGTGIGTTISKLDISPWPQFEGRGVSKEEALALLAESKPIIILCRNCTGTGNSGPKSYGGHYMVLKSINAAGQIEVNDPGSNNRHSIKLMTTTQIDNNGGFWYVYPRY